MMFIGRKNEDGDTLVEVILAIALISVVLVSAFNIIGSSYRTAMLSKERVEAVSLAQQQAERLRKLRDDNSEIPFTSIPFPADGQILSPTLTAINCGAGGCPDLIYKVSLNQIANVNPALDPMLKTYSIKVTWTQAGTTDENNTEIIFKLADRDPKNIQRDCSVVESC